MYKIFIALLSATLLSTASLSADSNEMTIYTFRAPPFHFVRKGKSQGYILDMVREMFKIADIPLSEENIVFGTFSSSFTATITNPNSIMLSIAGADENMFYKIGPFERFHIAIIAREDSKIQVETLDDLKNYKLATMKNIPPIKVFKKQGGDMKHVILATRPKQLFKMLDYGRIDAILFNDLPFYYLASNSKSKNKFKVVKTLSTVDKYIIISKTTPIETVNKLRKAFEKITKEDESGNSIYKTIKEKYISFTP